MPLPPPVIADVYKVTLAWDRDQGVEARNVFHVQSPGNTESGVATDIDTSLTGAMFSAQVDTQALHRIFVEKLDGTTASITHALAVTRTGQIVGGQPVPSTCSLISIKTARRGPRGRGRIYLGPVGETVQNAGVLAPATVTALTGAWFTFWTALESLATPQFMGIASYKHLDFNRLINISCDGVLATQRRRQQQLA